MARRLPALALAAAGALAGCHAPAPINANVEFQTEHGIVRGVSSEDGILALPELVPASGELSFRCRVGNGIFDDVAVLARKSDSLALLAPKTSHPQLARFAAWPAAADDHLFIEVRTGDHADLLRCHLVDGGRLGDLVALDEGDLGEVTTRWCGSGLYAWREGTLQLVGVLNGISCDDPKSAAFIGLDEISTLLPEKSSFFERRMTTRRTDFEYGIPRDMKSEHPDASDAPVRDEEHSAPASESPHEQP